MPRTPTTVGFLLIPGFALMSYAAAVEPLRAANQLSGKSLYRWWHAAPGKRPVAASNGVAIVPDFTPKDAAAADMVFVSAGGNPATFNDRHVFAWLRKLARRGVTIGGISGGPYILARAGLPVDQPVLMSVLPGEQILVYRRRTDPRFSDVLRALDLEPDAEGTRLAIAAETGLSDAVLAVYRRTLHAVTPQQAAAEPVHRLFYDRLVEHPDGRYPGGRLAGFYVGQEFAFPGVSLGWDAFSKARFRVNGILYARTVGAIPIPDSVPGIYADPLRKPTRKRR